MKSHCEGFFFRYFAANSDGTVRKVRKITPNSEFAMAEELILLRTREIFAGRPDLMEKLACMDSAMEFHLYQGHGFQDEDNQVYFFGRATNDGGHVILELATDEILYGGRDNHGDVLDVLVHEYMHVLDFVDGEEEGIPGGLDKATEKQFIKAREVEKERIRQGKSPLCDYALTNDTEFLAVLAEVFFMLPNMLYNENPDLYEVMHHYFQVDPRVEHKF